MPLFEPATSRNARNHFGSGNRDPCIGVPEVTENCSLQRVHWRFLGLPATGLEAVRDQADRGRAYRYYCERAAAHPCGVGCHWFQCYDQFALGRFDGENYNIGLFDITLRPCREMADAVRAAAENIYAVKAGEKPPFDEKPESLPMIAY